MKAIVQILFLSVILTSCATIFKKKSYPVKIDSDQTDATILLENKMYALPTKILVQRDRQNLNLTLIADSTYQFTVLSSTNEAFLSNLFWLILPPYGIIIAPVGLLTDLTNSKRYYYGKTIFLNTRDTSRTIRTPVSNYFHRHYINPPQPQKGDIHLVLSLPYFNQFNLNPYSDYRSKSFGFMGFAAGLEYFLSKTNYLNFNSSVNFNSALPFPAIIEYEDGYEFIKTTHFSLTHNHKINKFKMGYGLSYGTNNWHRSGRGFNIVDQMEIYHFWGLNFPVYYQLSKNFRLGMVYRPGFYRNLSEEKFKYEHLLSIDSVCKKTHKCFYISIL